MGHDMIESSRELVAVLRDLSALVGHLASTSVLGRQVAQHIAQLAAAVGQATQEVEHAGQAFEQLRGMVGEATRVVHGIAEATQQQAAAMAELARTAEAIAAAAQSTDEIAERLAEEVVEAARLAGHAREGMLALRLELCDGDLLELAKADHLLWKQRVYGVVLGKERIDPASVASHRECRLGRWYYGPGRERWSDHPAFQRLERPHEELHQLARQAAEAMNRGDRRAAEEAYQALERCSEEILSLLGELQGEMVAAR